MADIKIFIIHNTKPLIKAIDIIPQNPNYQNHLEYWEEYLSQKKFETVTVKDLYQNSRNLISIKIALEGNIVFMDTSKQNSSFRTGILFLPSNVSPLRKQIAARLTSSYDYLNILYNIHYNGISYQAEERDIDRTQKEEKIPSVMLNLVKKKSSNIYEAKF